MGVMRRWVLPALRIVLIAVIAAALVKLAFFPSGEAAASDPAVPTGELSDPVTTVQTGTILNDVRVTGSIVADDATPARATTAGTVDEVQVAVGQHVDAGTVLFDVKTETPRDPVVSTAPDGSQTVQQREPLVQYSEVTAPIAGIVSELPVLSGQTVAIGDVVGAVAPSTFSATATLSPELQYRLVARPESATVTVKGGPAPFTCTGLTITTPPATAAAAPPSGGAPDAATGGGGGGSTPTTTVRCAVPADTTVFAGLSADITIAAGKAEGVLTVPTTAVKGSAGTGVVYLPDEKGAAPKEHPVVLGLTDGTSVEIKDGLAEGDAILQFVPGADATETGGPCTEAGTGVTLCGQAGAP
ncbi:efflux RND transporter periplasmic adaptor subunit [Leifsonia sp. F6_8S_P_1B]|uniref:Efflux RND transporter periplasmic adaptor subunit n=1 Tax=Leifsonia williamsii TaxID=3035919 RepID=A0ABT8KE48_9MICO|nr:efflux RND transporter periplasmic adaptor subunit [Leifsonia williamsii]MDN4615714.1 efflux RND transporter periplasmic adaptor subunit [Leifsonia williamsii]